MQLENKVVLISGGAKGMGVAEAKLFAKEGGKLVIGDLLEVEGKRVEAEINEAGGECLFVSRVCLSQSEAWFFWRNLQFGSHHSSRRNLTGTARPQRRLVFSAMRTPL